ncbi:MAG: 16S rRNA (guanine(527)-N(7))-methyltransferase RsmG [Burkholderiaceae bacterium]|jgi:16S rRNA (guanine527-N7)-methyltransferase|nr:16S rRNA (guanine(527)-N(7))-methyltransferase RsmG [Burkholderiaceae bacterium]
MVFPKPPLWIGPCRETLFSGARVLGLEMDAQKAASLLAYLTLLEQWNHVYNLTAIRSPSAMLTHHILDTLAVMPFLPRIYRMLDVGSGAGIPGVILAIMLPESQVSLVEAVRKKGAFLTQVRQTLQLGNLTVRTARLEKAGMDGKFDAIISRAFSSLGRFAHLSLPHLSEEGCLYAMKGGVSESEMDEIPSGLVLSSVIPLRVPFLSAERHLLVLKREPPFAPGASSGELMVHHG